MQLIREEFEHWESAEAFIMGIELANDPDLACHEAREEDGKHVVYVHDWNDAAEDICPICGAGGEDDELEDEEEEMQVRPSVIVNKQ